VQDDHHAEEAYRAMTASLVQAQQGAKDLVGHANRLQDRFFCVYLHNPLAKVKAVEDDGITVESVTMRDRMSFAEVCLRHHLRFNLAEASAKSSRVLIGMISAEQQDGAQSQQQQQQQLMLREGSGNVPSSAAPPSSEEARQRDVPAGYIEGEQEMLGSSAFLGSQAHDGARLAGGSGRGHGRGAAHEHLSGGGARQSDYEMYKEMEGRHGRGMGGMPVGGMHGMAHPSDVAAFYGYHPHIDGMMAGGYVPSHRMPYGAMHGGYPPEMYAGAMEDMKHTHAKHAAMGVPPGMGGHMHPDARWSAGVPRMAGRGGMWQHPASARDVMRNMGLAGRFSRDGVDPRMLDAHGFGYDPSYAGHVGPSPHMTPSSHEMHMMHAMAGGAGTWGAGAMPGGMSRKVCTLARACVCLLAAHLAPVAAFRGRFCSSRICPTDVRAVVCAASGQRAYGRRARWWAGPGRSARWEGRQRQAARQLRWGQFGRGDSSGDVSWQRDARVWGWRRRRGRRPSQRLR